MKAKISSFTQHLRKLRFSNIKGRRKLFILSLIIFLLTIALVGALIINERREQTHKTQEAKKIDLQQITNLSSEGDCSKSINELSNVKDNAEDQEGSISLLSYRANCYYETRQYQKALVDAEQLKKYYESSNNSEQLSQINGFIKSLKAYIANPPQQTKPHLDGDQTNAKFQENLKKMQEEGQKDE